MVIRKINSVLHKHGKWLFGFISFALAASIVVYLGPNACSKRVETEKYGKVFDQDVAYADLYKMNAKWRIVNALWMNTPLNQTNDRVNDQQVFNFLAMEIAADRLGITVTNKELAEAIGKIPHFTGKDGKGFNVELYQQFITKNLIPYGANGLDADNALKFFVKISKLRQLLPPEDKGSDLQLQAVYNYLNQKYSVKAFIFPADRYRDRVKVTEKNLQDMFAAHSQKYKNPAVVSFDYVVFDAAKFTAAAAKAVTLKELEEYYSSHQYEFIVQNSKKNKNKETKVEYKKFDQVKQGIRKKLTEKKKNELAHNQAISFYTDVYTAIDNKPTGKVLTFKTLAAELKQENF